MSGGDDLLREFQRERTWRRASREESTVEWWLRQFTSRRASPAHVHRCPECYEAVPCGMNCTIEPDLQLDNGMPCGSYATCPPCLKTEESTMKTAIEYEQQIAQLTADYEQNYILPCFKWAEEVGIDLHRLVRDNAGKNCVELFFAALRAQSEAATRLAWEEALRIVTGGGCDCHVAPCPHDEAGKAFAAQIRVAQARTGTPEPGVCQGCGKALLPENHRIADGCPCNSPRGINHGRVPKNTCTCVVCDPEQTGSTRSAPIPDPDTERARLAVELCEANDEYEAAELAFDAARLRLSASRADDDRGAFTAAQSRVSAASAEMTKKKQAWRAAKEGT